MTDSVPPAPKGAGRRPPSDQRWPDPNDPVVQYVVHSEGVSLETAREMIYVQGHASNVADAAGELLGDRFCEVRIERPGALMGNPGPDSDYQQPPFSITLSADAADVAAAMHERFGVFVELRVGALAYPPESDQARSPGLDAPPHAIADPAEIRVELDRPLIIGSGQNATHGLLLTNFTDTPINVHTNGQLTARIADPASGRTVGGYSGAERMPLIVFTAAPIDTVRIPLLVGTASYDPDLGCAVPPGEWALYATLELSDGRTLNTPLLPLTISE